MTDKLCAAPHMRVRTPGEVYALPDGTVVSAAGTERVEDLVGNPLATCGHLCARHMHQLGDLIEQSIDMVQWLRASVHHGSMPQDNPEGSNPNKSGSKAPCSVDAIDAADLELATLAKWATRAGLKQVPGPVYRIGGEVRGLRYGNASVVDYLTRWLCGGLRELAGQEWAGEMLEDMGQVRRRHLARWPLEYEAPEEGE